MSPIAPPLFIFGWFRQRRRERLLAEPLSNEWREILSRNIRVFDSLPDTMQQHIGNHVKVFVAEKNWEGCGGLQLTDEMKVTISGLVGLLVAGLKPEYFDNVLSILVYPEAYKAPQQTAAGSGVVLEGQSAREGEAWYRGPVILSWADVVHDTSGRNPGHNLVLHEFAHQLDMLNGRNADGIPPLSMPAADRWKQVLEQSYAKLVRQVRHGANWIDGYGATNEAEFFAVTTEVFFEEPEILLREFPDFFRELTGYYGLNPLDWQWR